MQTGSIAAVRFGIQPASSFGRYLLGQKGPARGRLLTMQAGSITAVRFGSQPASSFGRYLLGLKGLSRGRLLAS